jgi:hypothetical protein
MEGHLEADLAFVRRVVARHCPEFYLHPADAYMPCTWDFFLLHSTLRNAAGQTLVARGALTPAALAAASAAHGAELDLHLDLHPAARAGAPRGELDAVPVYASVKAVAAPGGGVEALEVTYITLYAHNGAYTVANVIKTGAHDGDIEHVTVRVDPASGDLLGVWYNAHRPRDGEWAPAADAPRGSGGRRLVAFVALNGHGYYPTVRTIHRHFWLGNDCTSRAGPVWRPRRAVLLPAPRAAAADAAARAAGRVLLPLVPSRGSSLPPRPAPSPPPSVDSSPKLKGAGVDAAEDEEEDGGDVEVVADDADAALWLAWPGRWGACRLAPPGPAFQSWFHAAETPTSRSALLRVVGHLWPETREL